MHHVDSMHVDLIYNTIHGIAQYLENQGGFSIQDSIRIKLNIHATNEY